MHSMFPLFCNFRNEKSYKIRGTLQNKGTQNKGPPTVVQDLKEETIFDRETQSLVVRGVRSRIFVKKTTELEIRLGIITNNKIYSVLFFI